MNIRDISLHYGYIFRENGYNFIQTAYDKGAVLSQETVHIQMKRRGMQDSLLVFSLVRRPPCELNISCTSTTAESRAKIWYQ